MKLDNCEKIGCNICHDEVKEVWRGKCAGVPKNFRKYWKFSAFNPIQVSAMDLYDEKGNPSFVACSGTGTGKTVIAERAIIDFKESGKKGHIIVLVPLKALAAEKYEDWKDKFGLKVLELTGDTKTKSGKDLNEELFKHDIILTSYEMFNSWTRKQNTYSFLNHVCVLIVDEVHSLGSFSRGGELDGAITRFLMAREKNSVQTIMLSATFDNVDDLKRYMEQSVDEFHIVNLNFSPIKKHILPIEGYHSFRGQNEQKLFEMLKQAYEEHKDGGVLGLMYSRKGVENVADMLNSEYGERIALAHNAGMGRDVRIDVEKEFRSGKIKILVASPTIAMGVNLPGQSIAVIADFWDAYKKDKSVIPVGDYMQIVGRAGRPPFFKDAFIYTAVDEGLIDNYAEEMAKPIRVIGKLVSVMDSVINVEVFRSAGISAKTLFIWLKNTYSFFSSEISEDELNSTFKEELKWLIENNFVKIDTEGSLFSTNRGAACAISMHRPKFIKHVFNVLFNAGFVNENTVIDWTDEQLISLLVDMYDTEYSNVRVNKLDEDAAKLFSFGWITDKHGEINWGASAPEYAFIGEIADDLSRLSFMLMRCGVPRTSKQLTAVDYLSTAFSKGGVPLELVRLSNALKHVGIKGVGNKRLFVLYSNGIDEKAVRSKNIPNNLKLAKEFSANMFLRSMRVSGEVDNSDKIEKIYPTNLWLQHRNLMLGRFESRKDINSDDWKDIAKH